MPYHCSKCKQEDDVSIAKKRELLEYQKLHQEYKMLERMTEENNRRKYELERKMCKIPKEHCEDCQNMPAGDEETETELHQKHVLLIVAIWLRSGVVEGIAHSGS